LNTSNLHDNSETLERTLPFRDVLFFILVVLAGVLFAVNLMPMWLPSLSYSVTSSEPKVYWFLSRGSAIAAYWLLWLSVALGVSITNKLAKVWPGIASSYEIHQFTSLVGLGFALFHGLILMGDRYMNFNLVQVLVPFATQSYRPGWVGIGQLAFYGWAVILASFYVRKRIKGKSWRWFHYGGYACFLAIMVHSIFSGTDTSAPWFHFLYWVSGGLLLLLVVYRILIVTLPVENQKIKRPAVTTTS
jgi:predicted ferric reductase